MLILSRLTGESVYLFTEDGTKIEIKHLGYKNYKGTQATIMGINAPKSVKILREELLEIPDYDSTYHNP